MPEVLKIKELIQDGIECSLLCLKGAFLSCLGRSNTGTIYNIPLEAYVLYYCNHNGIIYH